MPAAPGVPSGAAFGCSLPQECLRVLPSAALGCPRDENAVGSLLRSTRDYFLPARFIFLQRHAGAADNCFVTKPRCVLPGIIYLVTRSCSEGRFFLRPDPLMTQIFEYLLGVMVKKYEIELHAYVMMSNHYHLVVTDRRGRLPDFERDFNSLLARSVNALRARSQNVWDRNSYDGSPLVTDRAVLASMAYTLANPVKARLVDRARQWRGATSAGMQFGRPREVMRPEKFFSASMPDTVQLELTRPACFRELSDGQLLAAVEADVYRREVEHGRTGKVMGMRDVLRQHWNSGPEGERDERDEPRPRIGGEDKDALREALRRAKEWLEAYRKALERFVGGERDVEFPLGTWKMCARLRCSVALE